MTSIQEKKYALPVVGLLGVILSVLIVKLQPSMEHQPQARPSVAANFITLKAYPLRPKITGFGRVKPDLSLQAKAEVSGRVVYVNPRLKKGEIINAGSVLVKIDDKDYQLQLRQAEADVLANQASLEEMALSIENNKLELKLAQQKLAVREKEYQRLSKLRQSGSVSQSKLDAEQQNLLQQKQEVQQLKNKQTTLPSELEVMKAKLAIAVAKQEKSRRDIQRTQVELPFTGRISSLSVEENQYVATGTSLFSASGLDKVIIDAQFPLKQFSQFSQTFKQSRLSDQRLSGEIEMAELLASLGLSARVALSSGSFQDWDAKVERLSDAIDPQSQTIGVTLSVSGAYRDIQPGVKPPLLEGMHMRVQLLAAADDYIAVPRFALQQNELRLISAENTLLRLPVSVGLYHGNLALLKAADFPELLNDSRLVTSELFPAVEGMALIPIKDEQVASQLASWVGAAR